MMPLFHLQASGDDEEATDGIVEDNAFFVLEERSEVVRAKKVEGHGTQISWS